MRSRGFPYVLHHHPIHVHFTFNETTAGLVATIVGKQNQPDEIGTVKCTWKDDGSAVHIEQLDNTLYFPKSLINIMSVT